MEAIHTLGSHLRLKPKSLFDHMVQESKTLEAIAARARESTSDDQPHTAKTYVISRNAVELLDAVARTHQVARDALLEASVQYLMPLIEKEQTRHKARKNLVLRMKRHYKGGNKLLDENFRCRSAAARGPGCARWQSFPSRLPRAPGTAPRILSRRQTAPRSFERRS